MPRITSIAICLALVGWSSSVQSSDMDVEYTIVRKDNATAGAVAGLSELHSHTQESIDYAELNFSEDLAVGVEVEIWPAIEGTETPWDVGPELGFLRNTWITDQRTGSLVRFNVTHITQAWSNGSLPNLGFVLRIVPPEETDGAAHAAVSFKAEKRATLSYFFRPKGRETKTHKESPAISLPTPSENASGSADDN